MRVCGCPAAASGGPHGPACTLRHCLCPPHGPALPAGPSVGAARLPFLRVRRRWGNPAPRPAAPSARPTSANSRLLSSKPCACACFSGMSALGGGAQTGPHATSADRTAVATRALRPFLCDARVICAGPSVDYASGAAMSPRRATRALQAPFSWDVIVEEPPGIRAILVYVSDANSAIGCAAHLLCSGA